MPAAARTRRVRAGRPRDRDQRVAGCPVVGEPAVTAGHVGTDGLGGAAFQFGSPRGGAERTGRVRVSGIALDRLVDGLPAGAPAEVRGKGAVDVDPPGLAAGLGRRDADQDPGRAEAALRPAGGDEATR